MPNKSMQVILAVEDAHDRRHLKRSSRRAERGENPRERVRKLQAEVALELRLEQAGLWQDLLRDV